MPRQSVWEVPEPSDPGAAVLRSPSARSGRPSVSRLGGALNAKEALSGYPLYVITPSLPSLNVPNPKEAGQ